MTSWSHKTCFFNLAATIFYLSCIAFICAFDKSFLGKMDCVLLHVKQKMDAFHNKDGDGEESKKD